MENTTPVSLYIHWPFCKAKCPYCDFNSHVREHIDQAAWRDALLAELAHMAALSPNHKVTSIFFGGGTPSLMPPETVGALLDATAQHWPMSDKTEITLEANPTSTEAANLAGFKAAGINRISMGIQSLRPEVLQFLGREHSAQEALGALKTAQHLFDRVSFDLIYARPEQSLKEWEEELDEALHYARGHLSLYQLTIEPNTAFHHRYFAKGEFAMPEESLAADFFALTQVRMEKAGMPAYEISNHAAAGEASRHNLAYWHYHAYIGVGPGAHGRPLIDNARYATACTKSPERWLEQVQTRGHGMEVCEALSQEEQYAERLLMGLRLRDGIAFDAEEWAPYINANKLALYQEHGLITLSNAQLRATNSGLLVLNSLIEELVK